jgi:flagellar protein FliS
MTTPHPGSDAYLAQRVFSASPEQQAALLMEAGQRHLGLAIQALAGRDPARVAQRLARVVAVLEEASRRLDMGAGGEVARNLGRLYDGWRQEVARADAQVDPRRLEAMARGMGGLREAWEAQHRRRCATASWSAPRSERVV